MFNGNRAGRRGRGLLGALHPRGAKRGSERGGTGLGIGAGGAAQRKGGLLRLAVLCATWEVTHPVLRDFKGCALDGKFIPKPGASGSFLL